jgi:hypothetical protein
MRGRELVKLGEDSGRNQGGVSDERKYSDDIDVSSSCPRNSAFKNMATATHVRHGNPRR